MSFQNYLILSENRPNSVNHLSPLAVQAPFELLLDGTLHLTVLTCLPADHPQGNLPETSSILELTFDEPYTHLQMCIRCYLLWEASPDLPGRVRGTLRQGVKLPNALPPPYLSPRSFCFSAHSSSLAWVPSLSLRPSQITQPIAISPHSQLQKCVFVLFY